MSTEKKALTTVEWEDGDAVCTYFDDFTLIEEYPNCDDTPFYGEWKVKDHQIWYRKVPDDEEGWCVDPVSDEAIFHIMSKFLLEE